MVKIVQQMCPANKYSIKCPYTRTPRNIVIHNTANDAPAANEVSYMLRNSNEVSYHVAVDDVQAIEAIPFNRNAWASGDGHGVGNMYGIHIEICYSLSGGSKFEKAERNAAEYTSYLLKKYGWSIQQVTKHQDYDGKYCPHRTLDLGWNRFLSMVQGFLTAKEEPELTKSEVVAIVREELARAEKERAKQAESSWAKSAIEFAKSNEIMSGDADGKFRPQSFVTRQELAQVAKNLTERLTED